MNGATSTNPSLESATCHVSITANSCVGGSELRSPLFTARLCLQVNFGSSSLELESTSVVGLERKKLPRSPITINLRTVKAFPRRLRIPIVIPWVFAPTEKNPNSRRSRHRKIASRTLKRSKANNPRRAAPTAPIVTPSIMLFQFNVSGTLNQSALSLHKKPYRKCRQLRRIQSRYSALVLTACTIVE